MRLLKRHFEEIIYITSLNSLSSWANKELKYRAARHEALTVNILVVIYSLPPCFFILVFAARLTNDNIQQIVNQDSLLFIYFSSQQTFFRGNGPSPHWWILSWPKSIGINGKDYIIHFDHLACQVSPVLPSADKCSDRGKNAIYFHCR